MCAVTARIIFRLRIIDWYNFNFRPIYPVVTAIQGLIDAADEQLAKRDNSMGLSKVSEYGNII